MEAPQQVQEPVAGPVAKKDRTLPASILIAALLIALSVVYSAGKRSPGTVPSGGLAGNIVEQAAPSPSPVNIKPVTAADHVRGSLNAPVTIVEFSDLECPFCKLFHPTLKQVIAQYGDRVTWVYRHLPLDDPGPDGRVLHSKAGKAAEASECAAELGGNDAFWAFVDRYFEVTPSNDRIDLSVLPQIAVDVGLNRNSFELCVASGRHAATVAAQKEDAKNAGARGTPYSVVMTKGGKRFVIPGALPFTSSDPSSPSVQRIIDAALE